MWHLFLINITVNVSQYHGIGIRSPHLQEVSKNQPPVGFLEAHSENYFGVSRARDWLVQLSQHYPISLHGVGLSLGRYDALDINHLNELKSLVDDIKPQFVSEHLAWSAYSHQHVPDLLPLPLTQKSLRLVCDHVKQMQDYLGRQIYIENPSNYAVFAASNMDESDFLNQIAQRTDCGLLMDINNIYISAFNVGRNPRQFISEIEPGFVKQFHLAGHIETEIANTKLLIDSHDQPVKDEVWELYAYALEQHGAQPTIVEWDSNIPELSVLVDASETVKTVIASNANFSVEQSGVANLPFDCHDFVEDSGEESFSTKFLNDIFSMKSSHDGFIKTHQARIKVYQTNCFSAIKQYLESVYPSTVNALGAEFSAQFLHHYISREQPERGNLHYFGSTLAQFSQQYELLENYPYIPNLIQLEWAIHSAYYANNCSISMPETVDEQQQLLDKPIQLNESVALFEFNYPIKQIWKQSLPSYQETVNIEITENYIEWIVVFKVESVEIKVLNESEYKLLVMLKNSATLQQSIAELSQQYGAETATGALITVLQSPLLTYI